MNLIAGFYRGRRGFCPRDDRGATAVEYSIMVGFIAVVIIVGVTAFGLSVQWLFQMIVAGYPSG